MIPNFLTIIFMKMPKIYSIVLIMLLFASANSFAQVDKDSIAPREKWNLVAMQGTVTEIVKETRDITLRGTDGNLVTITADENIERFDEIEVGDVITFEFWEYLRAEFRKPTAEEIAEPLVGVAEGVKAPEGMDPGAVIGAVVKAVVTIEALNRPLMIATVKGPRGNYLAIPMEDEVLITELNIGQVLILTYAEAVAVSLTKVSAAVKE
jgi:hypothetical protein